MKILGLTFSITLLISLAIFGVIRWLLHDDKAAESLAAFPLVASPHVYETLDRLNAKIRRPNSCNSTLSFKSYLKPWLLMALCGALTIAGLLQLLPVAGLGIVILVTGLADAESSFGRTMASSMTIAVPLAALGSYLVGRWIGHRANAYGILATLIAGIAGAAAAQSLDLLLLTDVQFAETFGVARSFTFVISKSGASAAVYTASALLGYWVGKRHRTSQYIGYLISILPPSTSDLLVGLATEEANRIAQVGAN